MFVLLSYNALLPVVVLTLLRSIQRETYTTFLNFVVLSGFGAFSAAIFGLIFSELIDGFPCPNLAIHGLAWYGTVFLVASAILMYRQKRNNGKPRRYIPSLILITGCVYCGLAVNSLLIEPTALVVREITITTSKITQPITIVFCADMQTRHIGRYERWVLQQIQEQNADVIIFGGDYLQGRDDEENLQVIKDWNQLFREINLQAPLGIYAVQGNRETRVPWQEMFTDTAIVPNGGTITRQLGEIQVTFLSLWRSMQKHPVPNSGQEDKFRIIVGHVPIFAMAEQEADLLLAGHTHGGQIQIPFLGPITTNTGGLVPRSMGHGVTPLPNGSTLIVSHGSGSVQQRVRFRCRPDIWVIRLMPCPSTSSRFRYRMYRFYPLLLSERLRR